MASIEKEIQQGDLQITKDGFFRLYDGYKSKGMSMQAAYLKVSALCENLGIKSYYSSFLSFKYAFYTSK
ncbi:hypothetical protein SAMN04487996_107116 [Dyadobacter soli]|uniref:Uncharacterized protein n=1 Tax=Dyadobacter soli TaxID=659014 RepID=A0A1G7G401_9BACT|nr:hypothetical protein [Dyadobacter soli]SDE82896.1 hypothetical protein SAMN04487996_107116 [Dyadobacter soli]